MIKCVLFPKIKEKEGLNKCRFIDGKQICVFPQFLPLKGIVFPRVNIFLFPYKGFTVEFWVKSRLSFVGSCVGFSHLV